MNDMVPVVRMDLGRAIRERRGDMLQEDLAEKLGISVGWLSKLENNKRDPSFALLRQMGDVFDIPFEQILLDALHLTGITL